MIVDFHLTVGQKVPDKEVARNRYDLFSTEKIKPAPPAFKLKKALALGFWMGEEFVVFVKYTFGSQSLKILYKPRAIECATAQVRNPVGRPDSASEPTHQTHRIHSLLTGPIGKR